MRLLLQSHQFITIIVGDQKSQSLLPFNFGRLNILLNVSILATKAFDTFQYDINRHTLLSSQVTTI